MTEGPWKREPRLALARLRKSFAVAREGRDPEGVHQIRVVSRRLRLYLELAGLRILEADLRWLRSSVALARDLDVILAGDVPPAFAAWLRRKRGAARRAVHGVIDHPRTRALVEALGHLPPLDPRRARRRVARLAERVVEGADRLAGPADPPLEDLHALRRVVRRLRYALDWLGLRSDDVEAFQDALGWLGDLRAALAFVEAYPDPAGLRPYVARLDERVVAGRRTAAEAWEKLGPRVEALTKT